MLQFDPLPDPEPDFGSLMQYELRLREISRNLSSLKADLKILAMPYNGEVSWGVYLTDKKGRYAISGEGTNLLEAVDKIWPLFCEIDAQYSSKAP